MAVPWRRQKMSESNEILVSVQEGIKTLTINLPKRRNALSVANALRMAKEVEKSEEDGTRVMVLTGAGGAFCAGADLAQEGFERLGTQETFTEQGWDEFVSSSYHRLTAAIYNLPRPVIAAVDGVAAGFGCSLALNADITLASTSARFIEVFINIALMPDGGSTYILPKLVGLKKAMEMALTGDPVDAEEALRLNMVNRVYPPEELEEKTFEWARRLAKGPVKSMGIAKRSFYEAYLMNSDQALDMESRRQARLLTQPDFVNAVLAFHQKKEPTFS
jgi:2-(1,2-epoxy-1,2-dihydrophenyl)acetyl-CoA isomerase